MQKAVSVKKTVSITMDIFKNQTFIIFDNYTDS